jgi:hypothetical protein
MTEDARDDDVTGLSDDAREGEVTGPEQPPQDPSLANRLIGSPGAGPESADPPEHAFEDDEDADR